MKYQEHQPKRNGRSLKLRLIASAIVLLMLALGFNAMLSLNSLEKLYVASIASQYNAIGKDLQRNIEKSLKFGKSLDKFVGMDKVLEDTKQHILRSMNSESRVEHFFTSVTSDISVSIAHPNGTILYSTNQDLVNTTLPEQARPNYVAENSQPADSYFKYQTTYIIPIPIRDMKKTWIGLAIITFDEAQIKALLTAVRDQSIRLILAISGGSALLLILVLNVMPLRKSATGTLAKLRLSVVMLLFVGGSQLLFTVMNANTFKNYYVDINKEKTRVLTTLLKEDIEFLFSKGISIEKLVKMDAMLGEIIVASPELQDIIISNAQKIPLYMATKDGGIDLQKASVDHQRKALTLLNANDPQYNVNIQLLKGSDVAGYISTRTTPEGYISTNLSRDAIMAKLLDIALDSGTILIISMLFLGEVLILIMLFIERQLFQSATSCNIHYSDIRPAGFLFFFGVDMTITFLPLYMEKLYTPIFGLSKDIVMSLPISIRVFFTAIAIVIAGIWLDRRKWHEPLFIGLLLVSGGILYSWIAPDAVHFIISRAVVGLGYGFALMAFQGFVIDYTDEENKAQGLTQFFAGVYSGSICGAAVGAMLADKIGFKPVFLIGATIIWGVLLYIFVFMRDTFKTPIQRVANARKSVFDIRQLFIFLFNRNILALILLMSIPAAIAEVGLVDYFSPVYLNRIGASQSNIGRIFMLHGLCLIYLAPFVGKYIDAARNKRKYIVLGGILGSFAFIVFYFSDGLLASAVAIFMLGMSASFESSRSAYVLRLQVSQELGSGQVISTLSSAYRVGQVLGPLIFSTFVLTTDIKQALVYLGGGYGLLSLLFLLFSQSEKDLLSGASDRQNN